MPPLRLQDRVYTQSDFPIDFLPIALPFIQIGNLSAEDEAFVLEDTYISISNMHIPNPICQCSV